MNKPLLPYGRQWIGEDDIRAVCEVLRGDWLTSGPTVTKFEEALADYCGAKHAVAVCNGTAALHAACSALGIKAGDVGLTSSLSFLASANCIAYCGGTPDFADIDAATNCLSPRAVEAHIQSHGAPAVVIPVDFAGVPADLPGFRRLADQYGFRLIEDAAHSVGSHYSAEGGSYRCGSCAHTELAILSFHPVKTLTTGEGGLVLTNDAVLARRVRMFANHGTERQASGFAAWDIDNESGAIGRERSGNAGGAAGWLYQQQILGYNFRITDIQCALGLSQFKKLEAFKRRRQEIVAAYNAALSGDGRFITPPWPENTDPAFHLYVLRLATKDGKMRALIARNLREKGIQTQVHYIPIHLQPWYRETFGYAVGKCPEAESVYGSCLSLPLYPMMTDENVDYVIRSVREATSSTRD